MTEHTESDYYRFRHFDPDNARRVLGFYTKFFTAGPVLELACGPGVFLRLLGEAGVAASGVDHDEGMVKAVRANGLDVVLGDALSELRAAADASLGGLFAAHFLEHLGPDEVQDVYRQAARALRPGGCFVAAVPNAACHSVLTHDFWRDPTHVRFYDPVVLEFFADQAGLIVSNRGPNPSNHPGPPPELAPPPPAEPLGALAPLVHEAIDEAKASLVQPRRSWWGRRSADPAPQRQSWERLGHLLSTFDERLHALQERLNQTRAAHARLVAELYPANEVYVVAVQHADGGVRNASAT